MSSDPSFQVKGHRKFRKFLIWWVWNEFKHVLVEPCSFFFYFSNSLVLIVHDYLALILSGICLFVCLSFVVVVWFWGFFSPKLGFFVALGPVLELTLVN